MTTQYTVNEIFYSLQGEGVRTGTPNVFVRFAGCNMRCAVEPGDKSPGGFDCDTEFMSGRKMTPEELACAMCDVASTAARHHPNGAWCILTGGEPGLQVDVDLIGYLQDHNWKIAIETNGSIALPCGLDWITVSPKVAEHCIKQTTANEVKYVRGYGQAIPKTAVKADHYLISPAFDGNVVEQRTMDWCVNLVKENPQWRLSVQQHKSMLIR